MRKNILGIYKAGNTLLHRLDPRVKLILSMALMVLVFFLESPIALGIYAAFVFTLLFISKLSFKILLTSLRPIMFILTLAFFLNIFTVPGEIIWSWQFLKISQEGLNLGILVIIRLLLLTMQTTVLITYTTSSLLLADSIESLLSPLRFFKVPVEDFALMISIALRFVPTLAEEGEKIIKAQSARGANLDTGGFIEKIKGFMTILIPLFVNSIKRAYELAMALEARSYGSSEKRTKYKPLEIKRVDIIFILLSIIIVALIIVAELLL